jgi:hypothetical protein
VKYADVITQYVGTVGSINWSDGLCNFCLKLPLSDYAFWKIIEVGDDFVYARVVDDHLFVKNPSEVYVHISRFVIKDQGTLTNCRSNAMTDVENK